MSLVAGTRLGPYEIQAVAGAGGMGEVYRARDTRLERTVAVKVLPKQMASEGDRLRRFQQEARAVAALNHPNILSIHDVGAHDLAPYLVTEFLEGESLRQRLEGGPMNQRKTLEVAEQIARGLAAAHDKGIVHRDLKPENIFITADGRVKLLDFGLVKLADAGPPETLAATATAVIPATNPGMVLGTVGYMSPEQARGVAVDYRSDQFSLGSVLYEMLTGKRPFQRDSSAQTMAAIIEDEPMPITQLNPKTPLPLRWIVERCLAKEPEERYASTRDLARDLQRVRDHLSEASSGSALGVAAPAARSSGKRWTLPAITALVALAAGWLASAALFRTPPPEPPIVQNLTSSGTDQDPAASPDGRSVVFTSMRDGHARIWLKQLQGGGEAPITEGPDFNPRFSPDGAMIAFTRREGDSFWVCRSSLVGSEVRKLAAGMSPEWSPDGKHIAFVHGDSVWTMDPDGSNARELQKLHTVNGFIHSVRWSPNGAWIAVEWQGGGLTAENIRFELISTDGTQVVPVKPGLPGGELSAVAWLGNEQVIYSRSYSEGSTGAVNSASSRLIRQQIPSGATRALLWVPGGVRTVEPLGPGRLVLDSVITRENLRELTLKNGKYTGVDQWITHGSSIDRQPRASPDGRWVVFSSNRSGNLDLWEASRDGTIRRITDDPSNDWDPGFAPDGKLVWASHRSGNFEIWMAEADGSGAHQVSHDGVDAENPTVTRDGWVIYNSGSKQPGLWRVREDGSQAKRIVPGVTNWPEVSPDGQYVMATGIRQGGFIGGRRQDAGYVAVYRIADGQEVARITLKASRVNAPGVGRARWMPDGKSIVFIDAEENGVAGIYRQDFVAGKDTAGSRILVMSNPDRQPETLGVSPDGTRIMYGVIDVQSNLLLVDGIRGIGK